MTCGECAQSDPGFLTGCSLGDLMLETRTVASQEGDTGRYSIPVKTDRGRLQESDRDSPEQHHHKSPGIADPLVLVVDRRCRTNAIHALFQ